MADALFLLYALTVSLELVLSLLMAAFLYLILAPGRRGRQVHAALSIVSQPAAGGSPVVVSGDPTQLAIRRAIETIARGENDMQVLIQTRRALQQAEQAARTSGPRDAADAPS